MGKPGGRKPKPTSLKLADGTFRADRHGDPSTEAHQKLMTEIPEVPQQLQDAGREKWLAAVTAMIDLQILEERYLPTLLIYGQAWDRKVRAEVKLEEDGDYSHTLSGTIVRHPAFGVIKDCEDRICRIHAELGFTPSSSTSIHKPAGKKGGIAARGKRA